MGHMDPTILHHGVSEGIAAGLAGLMGVVGFGAGIAYARMKATGSIRRTSSSAESADS
ncbi:hypothetical protein [Natronobacterium gregoryi]|uniref:Uncharacterized protein n=3 Tax=Natronobacterium gregoryi TaxID=44930 RepID=L0AMU9_NATGS|nr:hypothetical protein [Natronobacterium gregoryi]AFZ74527.1 hypothetical protein Natgr_3407 [Natronobacterium gregoryi SP2]SFI97448.1 hypothetical protein SAMN05443661_110180 [Natronobacterium gregoryi]